MLSMKRIYILFKITTELKSSKNRIYLEQEWSVFAA